MDGQLVAIFRHAHEIIHIRDIELGVNALAEHVHGHGDDINIAGALTIAEQGAFDTVCTRHQAKLSCGHRTAAIIMGVEAVGDAIAIFEIAHAPFNLIGVDVGRGGLNRERQIEDQSVFGRGLIVICLIASVLKSSVNLGYPMIFSLPRFVRGKVSTNLVIWN